MLIGRSIFTNLCQILGAVFALAVAQLFHPTASAGLVGVDRSLPPIRDWAFEQLKTNQAQFSEASQFYIDGNLEKCHEVLSKLRATNAGLPQPDLVIVWLQLKDQKLALAKSRLEKLSAAVPRDPQVALTLGQIALAEGRLADAAAQLERTSLLQLPAAWPLEQREAFARTTLDTVAVTYERQARWQDVKAILSTLIAMGDSDLQYTNRLARAHYNLGELDQTKALLTKVATRNAGALPMPLLMADLAYSSGRIDDADKAIKQAIELHPDNAEVQLWWAEWSLMSKDVEAAERALATAQQLGQNSARFSLTLGQCRLSQSNYAEAIKAFRQAALELESIKQPYRTAVATNLLALALVCSADGDQANREEAVAIAEQNALAYSSDPMHVGTLGWIYFKLGRPAEAEPLLRRALELNAQVPSDLSFFVADFYAQASDKREVAETFLKAALESSHGIFVMRPLANKLSATMGTIK